MLQPIDFVRSTEAMSRSWNLNESLAYTRWLATHHYENFHVVSLLLPKRLHQDFFNVYSFCRWADDLGDETGNPTESLRLLEWWRTELDAMYAGDTRHPVFIALSGSVAVHCLPREPFQDLIRAFVQDQTLTRYRNWDELHAYCRWSANPVGRLLLALCGYQDEERQRLSDFTCTALQLANFWQDVARDLDQDRVYIPLDVLAKYGYPLDDLYARRLTPPFRDVMREIIDHARDLFHRGLPLASMVDRRLAVDIELFSRGGMRVLEKIEAQGYNVLAGRPVLSKTDRVWLLVSTLARVALRQAA